MHIYLIRHAHAVDGENDAARPLSKKGLAQIRAVGRRLHKAEAIEAAEVWHSPLARSRQTAALLVKELRLKAKLSPVTGIRPGDDPEAVARRLGNLRQPVIVVGHEPNLGALASLLVTGRPVPAIFVFKKCVVLRLDREGARWNVRWQVSPEVV